MASLCTNLNLVKLNISILKLQLDITAVETVLNLFLCLAAVRVLTSTYNLPCFDGIKAVEDD